MMKTVSLIFTVLMISAVFFFGASKTLSMSPKATAGKIIMLDSGDPDDDDCSDFSRDFCLA